MLFLRWVWTSFLQILGHYCSFTTFFHPKNQNFQKMKKKIRSDIIILHNLRCVSNVEVRDFSKFNKKWFKINVGVTVFQRSINHSVSIVWFKTATSGEKKKTLFCFSKQDMLQNCHMTIYFLSRDKYLGHSVPFFNFPFINNPKEKF